MKLGGTPKVRSTPKSPYMLFLIPSYSPAMPRIYSERLYSTTSSHTSHICICLHLSPHLTRSSRIHFGRVAYIITYSSSVQKKRCKNREEEKRLQHIEKYKERPKEIKIEIHWGESISRKEKYMLKSEINNWFRIKFESCKINYFRTNVVHMP